MSAPTPDRPVLPGDPRRDDVQAGDVRAHADADVRDDVELAYRDAAARVDDGRGPARAVRANVLAAAREIAAQAVRSTQAMQPVQAARSEQSAQAIHPVQPAEPAQPTQPAQQIGRAHV